MCAGVVEPPTAWSENTIFIIADGACVRSLKTSASKNTDETNFNDETEIIFMLQMFQMIPFAVALVGSSLAAAWDLRTTEIPDEIPYTMIAVALFFYGTQSLLGWSYWPIVNSAIAGLALFGFGFVMYYFGQWGGGDAKLLAAIGFLLPTFSGLNLMFPFPASYLFNVFFVGAGYMLIYAFVVAVRNRKVISEFKRDVKAMSSIFLTGSGALLLAFVGMNLVLYNYFLVQPNLSSIIFNSLLLTVTTVGLFLIWKFARAVENIGFKKRISVKKLRVGDVLLKSKVWEGITKKDLQKIKRSGKKYVTIKEGVRFGPAFPLALLFTIYFGDAILVLIGILG